MSAKDKIRKHVRFTLKNCIFFLAFLLIVFYLIIFYHFYFGKKEVYATETIASVEDTTISTAKPIDFDKILEENAQEGRKEEYSTQETELEYMTKYRNNSSLPQGMIQVVQEGRQGNQEITKKTTLLKEEFVSEEQVSAKVTKAAMDKIVEIGTGRGKSNYQVKVGDTLYVTSDRLSVMAEPTEETQKVATLTKGNQLKLLAIEGNWYRVSCSSTIGFVKAESTTYLNPNVNYEEPKGNTQQAPKTQSISGLSFEMALNKPSGLSLEQFKKVLTDGKDKNKTFEQNAQYFYYIEQQYQINGLFVAAVGIHESAWGTSQIAKDKKNLFGYGAYDSNPYNGAYHFSDYSESIDLMARVFVKYYLNPKGTGIYGGEVAAGTYYNGPTLSGVNQRYATDKNWGNGVYTHMKYLYNKL